MGLLLVTTTVDTSSVCCPAPCWGLGLQGGPLGQLSHPLATCPRQWFSLSGPVSSSEKRAGSLPTQQLPNQTMDSKCQGAH